MTVKLKARMWSDENRFQPQIVRELQERVGGCDKPSDLYLAGKYVENPTREEYNELIEWLYKEAVNAGAEIDAVDYLEMMFEEVKL